MLDGSYGQEVVRISSLVSRKQAGAGRAPSAFIDVNVSSGYLFTTSNVPSLSNRSPSATHRRGPIVCPGGRSIVQLLQVARPLRDVRSEHPPVVSHHAIDLTLDIRRLSPDASGA